MGKGRAGLVALLPLLGLEEHAVIGPDAREGSGRNVAPVNEVVLHVCGDEVGVLGHTCVTNGIQGHMSMKGVARQIRGEKSPQSRRKHHGKRDKERDPEREEWYDGGLETNTWHKGQAGS